jgi:hypothetical protein
VATIAVGNVAIATEISQNNKATATAIAKATVAQ